MCSYCRKVRTDEGYYQQVEAYVSAHSEARFSHGICPECTPKVLASMHEEMEELGALRRRPG
jgi:hypothetical protein